MTVPASDISKLGKVDWSAFSPSLRRSDSNTSAAPLPASEEATRAVSQLTEME